MNFDLMGRLVGWLPGAGVGALVAGAGLWFLWDDFTASERCRSTFGPVDCVRWFGLELEFPAAIIAAGALGAVVGAVLNAVVVASRPT